MQWQEEEEAEKNQLAGKMENTCKRVIHDGIYNN